MLRLLLTLGTLALASGAYATMLKGWRSRQRRQSDLPAPAVPSTSVEVLVGPVPGLFVGTTSADSWLDRIAVHHLSDRAAATLSLTRQGVQMVRPGLPELLLPWGSVSSAEVETALGGKVVTTGMLVLTWLLGERTLRTAFRADDRIDHDVLRDAITARLTLEAAR